MSMLKTALFAALPPEWPDDPLPAIQAAVRASGEKVVVLDDDPTGTQTVHGVPVLTEWSVATLRAELADALPAVYLLTNSRSLPANKAQALNGEIGHNLLAAAREVDRRFVVVSRSDSTLRGHFPSEVDALAQALGGRFDATLLIPFFADGGRYTVNDIHYVAEGERLVPAGETDFARDASFGYRASNLREWVAEKTDGRIQASDVASISIDIIRRGGPAGVADQLGELTGGRICIVNAASTRDLAVVTEGLLRAEARGKRFLYRTAASFVPLRAGLTSRVLLSPAELDNQGSGSGLIIVGSHVARTSAQVEALLAQPGVRGIEVHVAALLDGRRTSEVERVVQAADHALASGEDAAIFTSRQLLTGEDAEDSLAISRSVSASLVAIVRALQSKPRYVLAKGGITSSDIATEALGVRRALVLGQIVPGVPVWQLGPESAHPGMAYIVFPGNVGGPQTLAELVAMLRNPNAK